MDKKVMNNLEETVQEKLLPNQEEEEKKEEAGQIQLQSNPSKKTKSAYVNYLEDSDSASGDENGSLLNSQQRKNVALRKRRSGQRRDQITGNYIYQKTDTVRPPDLHVSYMAAALIVIPSAYVFGFTNIMLSDSWIVTAVLELLYAASISAVMRVLFKCAYTEPGVILSLPTEQLKDPDSQHYTRYLKESDRSWPAGVSKEEHFFSPCRFEYAPAYGPGTDALTLSFCISCKIVRPPRSFHCGSCGVCVEEQDHHCPWMGTCIGKRNLHLFISFLLLTSLHGFITAGLSATFFFTKSGGDVSNVPEDEQIWHMMNVAAGAYGLVFGMTLLAFGSYTSYLMCNNITSNENLRNKWNSKRHQATKDEHNRELQLEREREPSAWAKLKYALWTRKHTSRLEEYMRLKEEQAQTGQEADFSSIDNVAVLKEYGIVVPEKKPEDLEKAKTGTEQATPANQAELLQPQEQQQAAPGS